ncbi:hypothetical protein ABZS29_27355 [Kribbella sp. NPDC005582]|uniref:hypothetical protein n=1 Tax=Kribbella sp. NPDC005582 TaxID=3156893 RepID=UPI0033ABC9C7
MALQLANPIPPRLLMWQRVRLYAVPPSMIEIVSARRAVGDWAGACAAARVDVDLDLRAVRDRHGTELVRCLRADLRRLAPDLLRWHMPRIQPDGRLRPGLTVALSRYGAATLVVRTPPAWADAGQRMSLALWDDPAPRHHPHPHPSRRFRLDLHRHLWDSTRYGDLSARCGADSGSWAAEAELLLAAEGQPYGPFTVRLGRRRQSVFELVAPDNSHVPTLRPLREPMPAQEIAVLPQLPEASTRLLPDLELLQASLIAPENLHPMVAAALGAEGPGPAAGSKAGDPNRVECRGEIHRIALRDGVLAAVDHDPVQLRREGLLIALGGPGLPCLQAIDDIQRDPDALPAIRDRIRHGDVVGALNVIEGLLGPRAILYDGPLRQELESAAARRIDHGRFRSGLISSHRAAGADSPDPELRRPRIGRRTPALVRSKRSSRARRRTGMA